MKNAHVLVLTVLALTALPVHVRAAPDRPVSAAPGRQPPSFVLDITAEQIVATPVPEVIPVAQYQRLSAEGILSVGPVDVVGGLAFQNDQKYAEQQAGFWGGFNGTLEAGGVRVALSPFTLRAGRFAHEDLVETPYALFVSSHPHSIPLVDLAVETDRFFITSRWLQLNRASRILDVDGEPIEDRGANIRAYGIDLGRLRIGFQDALVYADRQFDLEYLLNPVPGFFLQYLKVASGSPWSQFGNDNSIMGFFADFTESSYYAYGQFLVDDFNANAFLNPDSYQNPNKIAWSLGGSLDTSFGEFGLYHAGATKYTFQAYGSLSGAEATDTKYGYTYYPAVQYTVGSEQRTILNEDNYIGYLHGENNIAFSATYAQTFEPVHVAAFLEYTLSGSKSPANPWHEFSFYSEGGEGTRFLDDEFLESRLELVGEVSARFGIWQVFAAVSGGFVVNELELTAVPPEYERVGNEIPYFVPANAPARWFGGITLGGTVNLGM